MRSLISRIGEQAGLAAEYWRDGFYFYDRETGARALVEQRYTKGWAGEIHIQTQRGQAQALLERLLEVHRRPPCRDWRAAVRPHETRGRIAEKEILKRSLMAESVRTYEGSGNQARGRTFNQNRIFRLLCLERRHAGGREREAFVDQLCASREKKGIKIIRDKTAMRYGDRISKFMSRIARGDRIFVVLSDKYLKSAYCMHELLDDLAQLQRRATPNL